MTLAYRIAQSKFIRDLSGQGAFLYGGRWNPVGTKALYLSNNRSLAYLEYLVHQYDRDIWPVDLEIATISIANENAIRHLNDDQLPDTWKTLMYHSEVQEISDLLFREKWMGIRVPSVVVPGEYNYVLNPLHQDFPNCIKIEEISRTNFDERLQPNRD
ncbi:MAG: RES family NAD+ phosphorylase [Cyclobacteriaceae bacterium]